METITDTKTIQGRILKVGPSRQYCANWGEMLFRGREVIVCVGHKHKRQKIPMYIRDDSNVGVLNLTSSTLKNRIWYLSIHGELNTTKYGCIFIDRISLVASVPKEVVINNYF